MELLHNYIDSLALNGDAIKNGKALAKNKFQKLCISEDETVIFGECAGSGKNPYICSVDFLDKDNPIGRCSCPSRQIPCKHALGLMYAYADRKKFEIEAIPEDILSKRSKLEKRAENKEKKIKEAKEKTKDDKNTKKSPTKAQVTAAVKKINAQLEGIALAERLLHNMLQTGLASMDSASIKTLDAQVKQLGNYYMVGIQNSFHEIILNLKAGRKGGMKEGEGYSKTIHSILYMNSLLKKAKAYLTTKIEQPETVLELDTESEIEEQIGHAWKLEELMQYDKYIEHARLVQLSFYSYDDEARQEYVDEGCYFCLNNGELYKTMNYRPYKAVKYIKEDDSLYGVVEVGELFIYPGGMNKRIRWNGYSLKQTDKDTLRTILSMAKDNYAEVIKTVKNQIKNPASDQNPMALLKIHDVSMGKTERGTYLIISDSKGMKQMLVDDSFVELKTTRLLRNISKDLLLNSALLVMFENDMETGLLGAKPLALVTEQEITRLLY